PAGPAPARRDAPEPGAEPGGGVASRRGARRVSQGGGRGAAARARGGPRAHAARRRAGVGRAARARGRGGGGQIPRSEAPGTPLGEVDHLGVPLAVYYIAPPSPGRAPQATWSRSG